MHSLELTSVHAKNSLANLTKAAQNERTAAVRDSEREVVSGYGGVVPTIVSINKLAISSRKQLLLILLAGQVKHLAVGTLGHEYPRQITVQVAIEGASA